ncbi:hypothetical protein [Cecembia rubra]|uniref:hypothetical protein n=1 Tax=Cecembia rubra TaxID=1485585 RepID=UPI0011B255DD|nr:hypothetical protein [Cecembia rubra]
MTINFLSYSFSGTLVKEEKGVFMEKEVHCPICKQEIAYSSRYPKYLCSTCMDLCNDAEGRPVAFYNTSISGHGCRGNTRIQKSVMREISAM